MILQEDLVIPTVATKKKNDASSISNKKRGKKKQETSKIDDNGTFLR